ncbi:HNH endonuclease signature motif containing protein [Blastococcus capsensis]|uniref:HNH endonuclease signature motif containing protein n=1 Tax=Blastococcus capsensis TaxID=1564163 RepID=UPI00254181FF|nr:HNH endonuclease signature motif containing protein [Blastococcus capsensis]MDK3257226.1 HNH endonuclease [Blastococcus capsensis]
MEQEVPPAAGTGAPVAGRASGPLGAVQAADREIARQTALRARALAEFAATRPASADRQPGQPGAMSAERRAARPEVLADVSEWAAQELVVALSRTSQAAEALLERSLTLVHRLPQTLDALESGAIHEGHLWPMLGTVAPIVDATVRGQVEAEVLAWAAGRVTTPAQLGDKARRVVLRRDARDAAGRLDRALRRRGVSVRPDAADGMAVFSALLTVPEAQALLDALGRYADALDVDPEDRRTRGQKMADCLLDLVLRPGENGLPPVQAQLTVVAGVRTLLGGDEPGEIGGQAVPAEMVRALARALGLLPDTAAGKAAPAVAPPAAPPTPARAAWPKEEEAFADWCAATEALVLAEWGGAEEPPEEEMERYWAEQARFHRMPSPVDMGVFDPPRAGAAPPHDPWWSDEPAPHGGVRARPSSPADGPGSEAHPQPAAGTWAAADRAVDVAGVALLHLERAVGRAQSAVTAARLADADDEEAWQAGPEGRTSAAADAIAALAVAAQEQRAALADLLHRTAGGGMNDRPRIAVVDELTGALLALTDAPELRRLAVCGDAACRRDPARCDHDLTGRPGLGPPPPTDGYRPSAALDRYLRARDRRCRFPGCRRPVPRGGELDHDRPYPDGPTAATNLTGYCTGHHRGKHQAPGWRHELSADGTLTVTTPTGLVADTAPPSF